MTEDNKWERWVSRAANFVQLGTPVYAVIAGGGLTTIISKYAFDAGWWQSVLIGLNAAFLLLALPYAWLQRKKSTVKQLKIIYAGYGLGENRYQDVTTIVRGYIKQNRIDIPITNSSLKCDPYPGKEKHIKVIFTLAKGKTLEIIRHETDHLVLPDADSIQSSNAFDNLPTATKNDLTGNVEFYLNRAAKLQRFDTLMKDAKSVWVVTHQATTLRGNRAWWSKIERLLVLEKDGFAANLLATVTDETWPQTINNDIASAILDIGKQQEAKQVDAFFNSIVIGNPHSVDSWVAIEIYIPWSAAQLRPSVIFLGTEHAAAVKNITMWYEDLWTRHPKPNPKAEMLKSIEIQAAKLKKTQKKNGP